MAKYKRPTSEVEFKANFQQKKPLMNDTEAYYESAKCLFCYDAPCVDACPTGIDIPLFIKQIHEYNNTGSARTIFAANWLGNSCGIVCPTGVLCEGACVFNKQNIAPVQIGRLQNYATNSVISNNTHIFQQGENNGKKVAIIGAGPAGIACAAELRTLGYKVDIFEAKAKPSGLNVHGIAPYKITNEEALAEVEYLQKQLGFHILYENGIYNKKQLKDLEEQYHAIFLGVGLGKTASLKIKGENKKGVIGAVEFIEELREHKHATKLGEHIIVIGGGNTAMDAASEAARMGANQVKLVYRRDKESMGAYSFEYDLAITAEVKSFFNASPVEILGEEKVTGVKFIKTKMIDGRLTPVKGSEFTLDCDMVIKATGQAKQGAFYQMIDHISLDAKNKIIVSEELFQTSNPMYFAGGDAINGGAEVVNAAYDGKMAARGIHQWLSTQ